MNCKGKFVVPKPTPIFEETNLCLYHRQTGEKVDGISIIRKIIENGDKPIIENIYVDSYSNVHEFNPLQYEIRQCECYKPSGIEKCYEADDTFDAEYVNQDEETDLSFSIGGAGISDMKWESEDNSATSSDTNAIFTNAIVACIDSGETAYLSITDVSGNVFQFIADGYISSNPSGYGSFYFTGPGSPASGSGKIRSATLSCDGSFSSGRAVMFTQCFDNTQIWRDCVTVKELTESEVETLKECLPCEERTIELLFCAGEIGITENGNAIAVGDQIFSIRRIDCNNVVLENSIYWIDPADSSNVDTVTQALLTEDCDPAPELETVRECIRDENNVEWTQIQFIDPNDGSVILTLYYDINGEIGSPKGELRPCADVKYIRADRCCVGPAVVSDSFITTTSGSSGLLSFPSYGPFASTVGGTEDGIVSMKLSQHPNYPNLGFNGNPTPSNAGLDLMNMTIGNGFWGGNRSIDNPQNPGQSLWGGSLSVCKNSACCSKIDSFTLHFNDVDNGEIVKFIIPGAATITSPGISSVTDPVSNITTYTGTATDSILSITWPGTALPQDFLFEVDSSVNPNGGITPFTQASVRKAVEVWVPCDEPNGIPLYVDPITQETVNESEVECIECSKNSSNVGDESTCWFPTGKVRCYGNASTDELNYEITGTSTDISASNNTTTLKWEIGTTQPIAVATGPFIQNCIDTVGSATITYEYSDGLSAVFVADSVLSTGPSNWAFSGEAAASSSGKLVSAIIVCGRGGESGEAHQYSSCDGKQYRWIDCENSNVEVDPSQFTECPAPCENTNVENVACLVTDTTFDGILYPGGTRILQLLVVDCNNIIQENSQYFVTAAGQVLYTGSESLELELCDPVPEVTQISNCFIDAKDQQWTSILIFDGTPANDLLIYYDQAFNLGTPVGSSDEWRPCENTSGLIETKKICFELDRKIQKGYAFVYSDGEIQIGTTLNPENTILISPTKIVCCDDCIQVFGCRDGRLEFPSLPVMSQVVMANGDVINIGGLRYSEVGQLIADTYGGTFSGPSLGGPIGPQFSDCQGSSQHEFQFYNLDVDIQSISELTNFGKFGNCSVNGDPCLRVCEPAIVIPTGTETSTLKPYEAIPKEPNGFNPVDMEASATTATDTSGLLDGSGPYTPVAAGVEGLIVRFDLTQGIPECATIGNVRLLLDGEPGIAGYGIIAYDPDDPTTIIEPIGAPGPDNGATYHQYNGNATLNFSGFNFIPAVPTTSGTLPQPGGPGSYVTRSTYDLSSIPLSNLNNYSFLVVGINATGDIINSMDLEVDYDYTACDQSSAQDASYVKAVRIECQEEPIPVEISNQPINVVIQPEETNELISTDYICYDTTGNDIANEIVVLQKVTVISQPSGIIQSQTYYVIQDPTGATNPGDEYTVTSPENLSICDLTNSNFDPALVFTTELCYTATVNGNGFSVGDKIICVTVRNENVTPETEVTTYYQESNGQVIPLFFPGIEGTPCVVPVEPTVSYCGVEGKTIINTGSGTSVYNPASVNFEFASAGIEADTFQQLLNELEVAGYSYTLSQFNDNGTQITDATYFNICSDQPIGNLTYESPVGTVITAEIVWTPKYAQLVKMCGGSTSTENLCASTDRHCFCVVSQGSVKEKKSKEESPGKILEVCRLQWWDCDGNLLRVSYEYQGRSFTQEEFDKQNLKEVSCDTPDVTYAPGAATCATINVSGIGAVVLNCVVFTNVNDATDTFTQYTLADTYPGLGDIGDLYTEPVDTFTACTDPIENVDCFVALEDIKGVASEGSTVTVSSINNPSAGTTIHTITLSSTGSVIATVFTDTASPSTTSTIVPGLQFSNSPGWVSVIPTSPPLWNGPVDCDEELPDECPAVDICENLKKVCDETTADYDTVTVQLAQGVSSTPPDPNDSSNSNNSAGWVLRNITINGTTYFPPAPIPMQVSIVNTPPNPFEVWLNSLGLGVFDVRLSANPRLLIVESLGNSNVVNSVSIDVYAGSTLGVFPETLAFNTQNQTTTELDAIRTCGCLDEKILSAIQSLNRVKVASLSEVEICIGTVSAIRKTVMYDDGTEDVRFYGEDGLIIDPAPLLYTIGSCSGSLSLNVTRRDIRTAWDYEVIIPDGSTGVGPSPLVGIVIPVGDDTGPVPTLTFTPGNGSNGNGNEFVLTFPPGTFTGLDPMPYIEVIGDNVQGPNGPGIDVNAYIPQGVTITGDVVQFNLSSGDDGGGQDDHHRRSVRVLITHNQDVVDDVQLV